ncbi:hypothetical protein PR048_022691 [Dryococelus australis]|uniref:Uncharacterized protein n=1 Tax=Dryococelus australis TaxID=614101 RepID=A0ABQ9GRY5_9NEOP|nr:hypothetical protein PR048_022691 [Dryococelus australis]
MGNLVLWLPAVQEGAAGCSVSKVRGHASQPLWIGDGFAPLEIVTVLESAGRSNLVAEVMQVGRALLMRRPAAHPRDEQFGRRLLTKVMRLQFIVQATMWSAQNVEQATMRSAQNMLQATKWSLQNVVHSTMCSVQNVVQATLWSLLNIAQAAMSVEQRRNARAEKTGELRGNRPTSGVVRDDSSMRKSGGDPTGNQTLFALV